MTQTSPQDLADQFLKIGDALAQQASPSDVIFLASQVILKYASKCIPTNKTLDLVDHGSGWKLSVWKSSSDQNT